MYFSTIDHTSGILSDSDAVIRVGPLRGWSMVPKAQPECTDTVDSMTLPQARRSEATINGHRVHIPPGGHRLLKLLLLSNPQRFISPQNLVEAMWPNPETQPLTALCIVRLYVTRLRQLGVRIDRHYGFGYRIPPENRGLTEHRAQLKYAA